MPGDPIGEEDKKQPEDDGLVKEWRSRWVKVTSGAAWVGSVIVVFMDTLPVARSGTDFTARFPQFLLAIAFGLLLIAAHTWNRPAYLRAWVFACVASTVAGTALYFFYTDMKEASTEVLDGTRYVIGDLRTDPEGKELQQACAATNQGHPCDAKTLLDFCHGNLTEIWTPRSIARTQRTAVLYYAGTAMLFMLAMVSLLQGLRWAAPDEKKS